MQITWYSLNQIESDAYDAKSLLNVITDACLNQTVTPDADSIATSLSIAIEKLNSIEDTVTQTFQENRNPPDEEEDEEEEEEEEEPATESLGTLSVTEAEDGVFTFTASSEEMNRIFSVFITAAMIKGIEAQESENNGWHKLKEVAADLEQFLKVWEESDDLDYAPEVKDRRVALTKVLDQLKGLTRT
jgi:hypothetical protein